MILTDRNRSDRHRREKMLRGKKGRDCGRCIFDTKTETHKTAQHEVFLAFVFLPMSVWIHIYLNKCMADGQKEHALNTPEWVSVGDGTLRSGEERRQK